MIKKLEVGTMDKNIIYMKEALLEAKKAKEKKEVPIGAIIVFNDEIIGRGHNLVETNNNPTHHAEILAISEASKKRGWRLDGCRLYVTLEPCIMCTGAIVHSRIEEVVFSLKDPKRGFLGSIEDYSKDPRLNHSFQVTSGLLEEESLFLMQSFFKELRHRNKKMREEQK